MKKAGYLLAVLGLVLLSSSGASAQCFQQQLDFDFKLGVLDDLLSQVLVSPDTGENLWTGNMGSTPLWTKIPGQLGPGFYNVDNSGNNIDDDDQLDMLAAIINGNASVVGGLNPASVTAIRNAWNANVAHIQTRQLTLNGVQVTGSALGGLCNINTTVSITTGSTTTLTACFGQTFDLDIPSLWGPDGLLYGVDPLLESMLIEIGAGYMTLGDTTGIDYFQAFVAQVTLSVVQNLVPSLLEGIKSSSGAAPDKQPEALTPKVYTVPCAEVPAINEDINITDPIELDGNIFVSGNNICNALQNFINQFNCTDFSCQGALLSAAGNLNGAGGTNVATYLAAGRNRQNWMVGESIANPPLQITPIPAPQTVLAGANVTFNLAVVPGQVGATPEFRWETVNPVGFLPIATIGSSQALNFPYALPADSSYFLGSACDSLWTRQVVTQLTVNPTAFAITQQPTGPISKLTGESHTFQVRVQGGTQVPTYQWQSAPLVSGPWTNVGGATSQDLVFASLAPANSAFYRCVITGATTLTSNAAQLVVVNELIVSGQPVGGNFLAGEAINGLSVTVTGGLPPLLYQWFRNGNAIAGASNASLSIGNASPLDQGTYHVRVRDSRTIPGFQQKLSNTVTVTVLGLQQKPPTNQTKGVGESATLTVVPTGGLVTSGCTGAACYTYQWSFNDVLPPDAFVPLGITANTVSLTNLTTLESGQYKCEYSDLARTGEVIANLQVVTNPIVIGTQPQNAGRLAGQSVTFTCAATGGLPIDELDFEWFFNDGSGAVSLGTGTATLVSSSLTLSGLTAANEGEYFCRISDRNTPINQIQDSNTVQLFVGTTLTLDTQPLGGDFYTGAADPGALVAGVSGGVGPVTYQWFLNGSRVGTNAAQYDLSPLTPADAGSYVLTVEDLGVGNGPLASFTPTAQISTAPAVIRVAAALGIAAGGQPKGAVKSAGQTMTFTVAVTGGLGTVDIVWFKQDGSKADTQVGTGTTLTLLNVGPANSGSYFAQVSDDLTTVDSDPASLTVVNPLAFLSEPQSAVGDEGSTVILSASATGGLQNYTFQWRKEGLPILGATSNSLILSNLSAADVGSYSVTVTDGLDTQVSGSAQVSVSAALPVAAPLGLAVLAGVLALAGIAGRRRK